MNKQYKAQNGNLIKIVKSNQKGHDCIVGWNFQPKIGDTCVALVLEDSEFLRAVPNDASDYDKNDYCLLSENEYEVIYTSSDYEHYMEHLPNYGKYIPQIGDTVEIIANNDCWQFANNTNGSGNKIGDIGTITEVDGPGKEVRVTVKGKSNRGNWSRISEIKLITENKKQPVMKEPAQKSIHDQILETLNLKQGDKIKITHKVPSMDLGWICSWPDSMDRFVSADEVYTVSFIEFGNGIQIKEDPAGYSFPAQCVQLVERKKAFTSIPISDSYTAKVYEGNKVVVGCQTVNKTRFDQIVKAFYPNLKNMDLGKIA